MWGNTERCSCVIFLSKCLPSELAANSISSGFTRYPKDGHKNELTVFDCEDSVVPSEDGLSPVIPSTELYSDLTEVGVFELR